MVRVPAVKRGVSSAAGTGKTSLLLPGLVCWFLSVFPSARGLVMSTNREQLFDKAFANTKALIDSSPELSRFLRYAESGKVWVEGQESTCFVVYRTAEEAEGISGTHSHSGIALRLFDESGGIADSMYVATSGLGQDPQSISVAFGNPTRDYGWFYDVTHGALAGEWSAVVVSALDMPGNGPEFEAEKLREHGGDRKADGFRIYVLGLPALSSSTSFIPAPLVEAAQSRALVDVNGSPLVAAGVPVVAGLDLAREGSNENWMHFTAGIDARTIPPVHVPGRELPAAERVDWVLDQMRTARPPYGAPLCCWADYSGLDGMFDLEIRRRGWGERILGRNFGVGDPSGIFEKMRGHLWGGFRQWLRDGGCLPARPALRRLIGLASSRVLPGGKIQITRKADMRKVFPMGPFDELDAILLSVLAPPPDLVLRQRSLLDGGGVRFPAQGKAAHQVGAAMAPRSWMG